MRALVSSSHQPWFKLSALFLGVACWAIATSAQAQTASFSTPGSHTYSVPAGMKSLQVVVKSGGGGAGGWDDAHGGDGAPGAQVTATIAVQGGETVQIVVGGGGAGAEGTPRFGFGGDGGTGSGAGGNGGDQGTTGSSPGGGGGGGASSVQVGGAFVRAGGGGGGAGQTVTGPPWNNPPEDAINALLLNQQDAACPTAENGGNGVGRQPVDGSGGGGGGGGYTGHAGIGGENGVDRAIPWKNGSPGTSGASCTLSAGTYLVVGASVSQDVSEAARGDLTLKGQPGIPGLNGSVVITPSAVAPPVVAVPTLNLLGLGLLGALLAVFGLRQRRG